jgi:hypothetical protein
MGGENCTGGIRLPLYQDIPVVAIASTRHRRTREPQFTRVFLEHVAAVGRCRTGRAAALYLLTVRGDQVRQYRNVGKGNPRWEVAGVRVPAADLETAGLHNEQIMRRATAELIELGLVRRVLRPGYASLLELLPPHALSDADKEHVQRTNDASPPQSHQPHTYPN